ncbi:hypothetical protein [Ruegeria sp.]|uniref:hypothetical protein n=1 Tax=Ruegeria sp. TaxID=1879320 RepID=UPI003AFF6C93
MTNQRYNADLPEPADLHIRSNKYQPTKAELEEEIDMPEMSLDEIRAAFMRPMSIKKPD